MEQLSEEFEMSLLVERGWAVVLLKSAQWPTVLAPSVRKWTVEMVPEVMEQVDATTLKLQLIFESVIPNIYNFAIYGNFH